MLVRSISEQEALGVQHATRERPYVGLLMKKGQDWTWYVAETFVYKTDAEAWWESQSHARIIQVKNGKGILDYAK